MNRFVCTCAYDGTDFFGWQSQKGGNTLQDIIEKRLFSILKVDTRIHASGRTDSGVHAKGQVFHFDAHWNSTDQNFLKALCSGNPGGIEILSLARVSSDFHARYSVKSKRYVYTVHLGRALPFESRYMWSLCNRLHLDISKMQEAAKSILGTHDFSSFGANLDKNSSENPIKTLTRLDILLEEPYLIFVTEATGYLYKMVRSLVGSLLEVGRGKLLPSDFVTILNSHQRTSLVVSAPPQGLCLDAVFY